MLKSIKEFFENSFSTDKKNQVPIEEQLNLAAATLLVEISYADMDISEKERALLKKILQQRFLLSQELVEQLIKIAEQDVRESNSVYEVTRIINTYFEKEEKYKLVQAMWEIALIDNELDIYEESMIRKLADLLYVSHSDFIRAKLSVTEK